MLYFAYGSNLNHFQMKRRCKDSIFLKKINLNDFRLTFRSRYRAADIELKKNSIVPGGLYEISKREEFYQQEYCGCVYSLRDTNRWRKENNRPRIKRGIKFYNIT